MRRDGGRAGRCRNPLQGYFVATLHRSGGVGISVAIQDASVASNVLGPRMRLVARRSIEHDVNLADQLLGLWSCRR